MGRILQSYLKKLIYEYPWGSCRQFLHFDCFYLYEVLLDEVSARVASVPTRIPEWQESKWTGKQMDMMKALFSQQKEFLAQWATIAALAFMTMIALLGNQWLEAHHPHLPIQAVESTGIYG